MREHCAAGAAANWSLKCLMSAAVLQMLNKEMGGSVHSTDVREDGQYVIEVDTKCTLFK